MDVLETGGAEVEALAAHLPANAVANDVHTDGKTVPGIFWAKKKASVCQVAPK